MGNLLFSPDGRIGRQEFQKGAVILLAVNFFLWPTWYVSLGLGLLAATLSLGLVYCWACLFIKRLHGAGKSGWLFLPYFLCFVIVSYMLGSMLMGMLSPDIVKEAMEFQQSIDPNNRDLEAEFPFYKKFFKAMAIPFAAAYFIVGSAIAFITNANLPDQSG